MVLVLVIILLLFAFLLVTAVLAFVYSSNLTTFSREHRMVALERAEAGLNTAAMDLNAYGAALPEEITLPEGYSHADYVAFLDGLDDAYYIEDADGEHRYYLTDDDAIIGYGWQQDFKRIVRCEYSEYYFPGADTPAALYVDSDTIDSQFDGNAFRVDGNDHDVNGGKVPGGVVKPGIMTTSGAGETSLRSSLTKAQEKNVKGTAPTPSITTDSSNPVDVERFSAQLDGIADYTFNGFTQIMGRPVYGGPEHPIIMVVNGDMQIAGRAEGWGILDIRGSLLSGAGNLLWHGLILVHGAEAWIHGNPDVIGSMWIKSEHETLRISGDPDILFSSAALEGYGNPGIFLNFTTWDEL